MREEEKLVCSSSLAYFCLRLPRSDPQPQIVKHLSRWSRSQDDSTCCLQVCKMALLSQIRNSEQKNRSLFHDWWKLSNVCHPSEICATCCDSWVEKVTKSKLFIRLESSYHFGQLLRQGKSTQLSVSLCFWRDSFSTFISFYLFHYISISSFIIINI